jgi:hypothetical protein
VSRASVLALGRRKAEAGMTDTCLIERVISTIRDLDTGASTPVLEPAYSGRCRLKEITAAMARDAQPAPSVHQAMRYRVLQLPVIGSEGIQAGDLVTILTCVNDPDMVGAHMVVRDQSGSSEQTARRLGVEEVTG